MLERCFPTPLEDDTSNNAVKVSGCVVLRGPRFGLTSRRDQENGRGYGEGLLSTSLGTIPGPVRCEVVTPRILIARRVDSFQRAKIDHCLGLET